YVLRPLLCSRWILLHQTMPPTQIQDVLMGNVAEPLMNDWILETIEQKRMAAERQLVEVPEPHRNWIGIMLKSCGESAEAITPPVTSAPHGPLNELFRGVLTPRGFSGR